MMTFAVAVFLLLATPGPGVLSLAGVGAAFGWRPGISYFFGLFISNNLVCAAVISGLATMMLANSSIRTMLLIASTTYLGYLAFRVAFAGTKIAFIRVPKPGLVSGVALQLINPKAYAVHIALFSGFAIYPNNFSFEVTLKLLIGNVIWILLHFVWLYVGVLINRLELPERAQRVINLSMAVSLLVVVGLSIWSILN